MKTITLRYEFNVAPAFIDIETGEEYWHTKHCQYVPYDETVQDVIIEFVADKYNIESGNLYELLDDLNVWDKLLNAYYEEVYELLWNKCYKLAEEEFRSES